MSHLLAKRSREGTVGFLSLALVTAAHATSPSLCPTPTTTPDAVTAVGPRGELTLSSVGRAVLAGIRWPDDMQEAQAAEAALRSRGLEKIDVSKRASTDRWGRTTIDASDAAGDWAAGLVSTGLVAADAGEADIFCRTDLLALEEAPRREGRGIWAAIRVDPLDAAALAKREGDFVVAQGIVFSVSERDKRSYLNFTSRQQAGLSVTVSKRTWRIMRERGLTADTLKGRLVRVRGTVEIWRAPMLDIASADMIEVLDGNTAQKR